MPNRVREFALSAAEGAPRVGADGAPVLAAAGVSWNGCVGRWQALAKTTRSRPPRLMHVGYFAVHEDAASALDRFVSGQQRRQQPQQQQQQLDSGDDEAEYDASVGTPPDAPDVFEDESWQ